MSAGRGTDTPILPLRAVDVVPLGEPVSAFLARPELDAIEVTRQGLGVDVTRTYQFWESAVARITTGTVTSHGCPWDVVLPYGDFTIRIEVKFAQEFMCRFGDGPRPVFKFAAPKGTHAEKPADVVVLVGIDELDMVHTWAVPAATMPQSTSITMTSPRARAGQSTSRARGVDDYRCPLTQLLPEILRAYRCHLRYDAELHKANAAWTRAGRPPVQLKLFSGAVA